MMSKQVPQPHSSGPAAHVQPPQRSLLQRLALGVVLFYRRFISPLTPPSCRHVPTCSGYALEAISLHGGWRGGWLALLRVLRCHPFHPGGWDPVPLASEAEPQALQPTRVADEEASS